MLFLWWKEEMLEELTCRESLSATHIHIFGNITNGIYDLLVFTELHALLTIVPETNRLANLDCSAVMRLKPEKHLHECGFACTVVTHNTHLLVTGKVVFKVLEDYLVAKRLAHVLCLKNL